ncbi:unnamed protein product [Durusdinium trenchii]|uniref:Secreted protein n=1 Tax=Durusdinium trenchii TaxID=1381693 RepID=A0ABP0SH76_9DINO
MRERSRQVQGFLRLCFTSVGLPAPSCHPAVWYQQLGARGERSSSSSAVGDALQSSVGYRSFFLCVHCVHACFKQIPFTSTETLFFVGFNVNLHGQHGPWACPDLGRSPEPFLTPQQDRGSPQGSLVPLSTRFLRKVGASKSGPSLRQPRTD